MEAGTKKVLLGIGLGCGGLVLVAVLTCGGFAWWVRGKAKTWSKPLQASHQMIKAQKAKLEKLDHQYPFTPPKKGPYVVPEARLKVYLAVREAELPTFAEYEAKVKHLDALQEKLHGHHDGKPSLGEVFSDTKQALRLTSEIVKGLAQAEKGYADALEKNRMSPSEFRAITGVVYPEHPADSKGPNAALLAQYAKQIQADASDELNAAAVARFQLNDATGKVDGNPHAFHFEYHSSSSYEGSTAPAPKSAPAAGTTSL